MRFIMSEEILENVYSKISSLTNIHEDGEFVTFRDNHFEVILTQGDKAYNGIRLSVSAVNSNVLSGDINLVVYSTKTALKTLSELHKNDKMNLQYIMYIPDGSDRFEVFNGEVTLNDITFDASYNSQQSNTFTMRFTL